jgi:predicted ArsR family transcriptional regulator
MKTEKTRALIIDRLKNKGALTAKQLSEDLGLTTMGIRQHLLALEGKGELSYYDQKAERGRPTRYWQLTQQTQKKSEHFADRHSELTLQLIESVQTLFGDDGLDKLISDREEKSRIVYQQTLSTAQNTLEKVQLLAQIRADEGYMAVVEQDDKGIWLLENHCPICAAASKCQNFCRSELALFQSLFSELSVTRTEHIIEGARRCAYLFD